MTMNPREKDLQAKKEIDPNYNKFPSSSRQWSNNKNPRIVRVSRTFGGKDRHSKVRTVKGLRDRRIRLSVPTAIQLYDLQDRLGLGQPSKVVDWLLDATKDDIDKLPPLPMIPGNFTQFQESTPSYNPQHSLGLINPAMEGIKIHDREEKNKWINASHSQNQEGLGGFVAQNLFPLSNYRSSFPHMPYNSNYFHWDPQNLSLSQFGGGYSFSTQTDQDQQQNCSFSGSSSQIYFCPSSTHIPSIFPTFPSYLTPTVEDVDMRSQFSELQQQNSVAPTTLHLIGSPMKSLALNENSRTDNSSPNDNGRRDKGKIYS